MTNIAIIASMEEEVIAITRRMLIQKKQVKAGMIFYKGLIDKTQVILVRSGMGQVGATVAAQILISEYNATYIVNTGLAAGMCPGLKLGDVIVATDITQADKYPVYADNNKMLCDIMMDAVGEEVGNERMLLGSISSQDAYLEHIVKINYEKTIFVSYCAEVEGAAIAHCCALQSIPFIIVRTISDVTDQQPELDFDNFIHDVTKTMSRIVERFVKDKRSVLFN
ncbi:MAG: 5'-methylthioadenosine/S-adenosylhomocysteine nucleosidase [Cellulosilyticaceae bacterium]